MDPKRRRIIVGVLLVAYLGFGVWAFYFSRDAGMALYIFIPVSALIWIAMRALRKSN